MGRYNIMCICVVYWYFIILYTHRYLLIIPTLLQLYASHHTNKIVTRSIEYTIKQFYLMNRKPFILQMFGSASSILDLDDATNVEDSSRVCDL